jgi:2-keto-4-pentenoate hydratase
VDRLTDDQIQEAADLLVGLREGRLSLAGLPPGVTPDSTADVQRIIDAVSARIDRPVRGWKTYTLYKPMNPPFHAPIYDVLASGASIPSHLSSHRLIEPEIMFRADRDLPTRERRYEVAEVMDAVTAIIGFEVIGSRFQAASSAGGGQGSLLGALSDHIANAAIVVGDEVPGWRDVVFEDVALRVTEGDRVLASVVGCHPFDDPFLPVVVGVNRLRRYRGVRAGDVIVTNSSTSFFPVAAGALIRATYDGLGEVTATFARQDVVAHTRSGV